MSVLAVHDTISAEAALLSCACVVLQVGKMIEEKQVHEKQVQDMQLSLDGTHVVTASTDRTSKLVDVQTLETLKTYNTERPANSAAISPIYDHVSADPVSAEGDHQFSLL